jgi:hypothetical protein
MYIIYAKDLTDVLKKSYNTYLSFFVVAKYQGLQYS